MYGVKPQLPLFSPTKSAGNPPEEEKPPKGFLPTVPQGFQINIFAAEFQQPRWSTVSPNGDIFLADTHGGAIYILRDPGHTGGAQQRETFLSGLDEPFGIVFHDNYIYVGDEGAVVRYKFDPQTSKRLGEAEKLMDLPRGGHSTRALAFSADGNHLFVSVGSKSNVDIESDRGALLLRSAIPMARMRGSMPPACAIRGDRAQPTTGQLSTTFNERDGLGDDLPPDYFTRLKTVAFTAGLTATLATMWTRA